MRILGLISGTSHDGVDAALVDFEPTPTGLDAQFIGGDAHPYDPALRSRLMAALPPADTTAAQLCKLDTEIGQFFAHCAVDLMSKYGRADVIASHGQTLYHWVEQNQARGTLQIGEPAWIAEETNCPVISDLRSRDLAAGGQGAPLVPILDEMLLRPLDVPAAALNLGGIANMTLAYPGRPTTAYDIGPSNALIDAVVAEYQLDAAGYDTDGHLAAMGNVDNVVLNQLLAEPYYRLPPPKSTGKELFNTNYLHTLIDMDTMSKHDLAATLTMLTARTVSDALRAADVRQVVVSGGGFHNRTLMRWLAELLPTTRLVGTDELGVPPDLKEAVAFAFMGWCTWHGLASNVPTATGAHGPRMLGSITPGRTPLRLPEPVRFPAALRFIHN